MYLEVAQLEIQPGKEGELEAAMAKASPLIRDYRGCLGLELRRSVESPSKYWLFVHWESIELHLAFGASPLWNKEIGPTLVPLFAREVLMEHTRSIVKLD